MQEGVHSLFSYSMETKGTEKAGHEQGVRIQADVSTKVKEYLSLRGIRGPSILQTWKRAVRTQERRHPQGVHRDQVQGSIGRLPWAHSSGVCPVSLQDPVAQSGPG